MSRISILVAIVVLGLTLTPPELAIAANPASDPTAAQYHDPGQAANAANAVRSVGNDGLPYTGADLLALAGVAAVLVVFGIALIRISRPWGQL
jgi:hypothetical protein